MSRLDPAALGLAFEPVKARGLEGAAGSTGFPGLFLGFSIFLIAAAALLVALLFALGLELRAKEIGLLLAVGYPLRGVRQRLLAEAAAVAALGALAGLALAAGYARALLALLGRWWAPLVEGDVLGLALEPATLAAGFAASLALTLLVVHLTLRRLAKVPARALLSGVVAAEEMRRPRRRRRAGPPGGCSWPPWPPRRLSPPSRSPPRGEARRRPSSSASAPPRSRPAAPPSRSGPAAPARAPASRRWASAAPC